ncbi:MAG: hypothetical protein F4Y44_00750 [Chloroflexi bacterium]|nr:hypothetical protein [Chloroflexota bacterium]
MQSASSRYWTLDFAHRLTIPSLTSRVEETFDTATQRMERSIAFLADNGGPDMDPEVIILSNHLLAAESITIDAMKLRTAMVARECRMIGANKQLLARLQREMDGLVAEASQSSAAASIRYEQAESNGRIILVIAIIGIVGTLLVTGFSSVRRSTA